MTFVEILDQYNIECKTEGHHHCRLGWVQLDCPFCGKDTYKWHLGFNLEGKYLHCWRCGPIYIITALVELTELSFSECKKLLDDVISVRAKKEQTKGKLILPNGVGKLLIPHIKYLLRRNFNPELLQQLWKIQGIGIAGRLSWRILIPIIDKDKIVSWTSRSISTREKVLRYISASLKEESIPHKELLYGEDYAYKSIIITEGPFDVWRIGPGAVATLGTNYSNKQLLRMTKYMKRIICFDNQKEAQERAKTLCNDLSVFTGETFNVQLDAKDPASADDKEIRLLRKELG